MDNLYGTLYFESRKGLLPWDLNYGKMTLGSASDCNVRIKGECEILLVLDCNKEGVAVLEDKLGNGTVTVNGEQIKKYAVLKNEDCIQIGNKNFKYSNPLLKENNLKATELMISKKIIYDPIKRRSERFSVALTPLKRLQKRSPKLNKQRRFSTGSRLTPTKNTQKISERNLLLSGSTSTPLNVVKERFSRRMTKSRNSSLSALKENELAEFNVGFPTKESKTPMKQPMETSNLQELDLNATEETSLRRSCRRTLSKEDVTTTPENSVSAVSITPLNVSKMHNKSKNASYALLEEGGAKEEEGSTPKSALKGRRTGGYRPIVEDITPVSPQQRISLRLSSLKKPAFTQRRSVNFDVSSASESSLDLDERKSSQDNTKRMSQSEEGGINSFHEEMEQDFPTSPQTKISTSSSSPAPITSDDEGKIEYVENDKRNSFTTRIDEVFSEDLGVSAFSESSIDEDDEEDNAPETSVAISQNNSDVISIGADSVFKTPGRAAPRTPKFVKRSSATTTRRVDSLNSSYASILDASLEDSFTGGRSRKRASIFDASLEDTTDEDNGAPKTRAPSSRSVSIDYSILNRSGRKTAASVKSAISIISLSDSEVSATTRVEDQGTPNCKITSSIDDVSMNVNVGEEIEEFDDQITLKDFENRSLVVSTPYVSKIVKNNSLPNLVSSARRNRSAKRESLNGSVNSVKSKRNISSVSADLSTSSDVESSSETEQTSSDYAKEEMERNTTRSRGNQSKLRNATLDSSISNKSTRKTTPNKSNNDKKNSSVISLNESIDTTERDDCIIEINLPNSSKKLNKSKLSDFSTDSMRITLRNFNEIPEETNSRSSSCDLSRSSSRKSSLDSSVPCSEMSMKTLTNHGNAYRTSERRSSRRNSFGSSSITSSHTTETETVVDDTSVSYATIRTSKTSKEEILSTNSSSSFSDDEDMLMKNVLESPRNENSSILVNTSNSLIFSSAKSKGATSRRNSRVSETGEELGNSSRQEGSLNSTNTSKRSSVFVLNTSTESMNESSSNGKVSKKGSSRCSFANSSVESLYSMANDEAFVNSMNSLTKDKSRVSSSSVKSTNRISRKSSSVSSSFDLMSTSENEEGTLNSSASRTKNANPKITLNSSVTGLNTTGNKFNVSNKRISRISSNNSNSITFSPELKVGTAVTPMNGSRRSRNMSNSEKHFVAVESTPNVSNAIEKYTSRSPALEATNFESNATKNETLKESSVSEMNVNGSSRNSTLRKSKGLENASLVSPITNRSIQSVTPNVSKLRTSTTKLESPSEPENQTVEIKDFFKTPTTNSKTKLKTPNSVSSGKSKTPRDSLSLKGKSDELLDSSIASNSITYSFVDSSIDDNVSNNSNTSLRRSVRKRRPTIDEDVYEIYLPKLGSSQKRKLPENDLTDVREVKRLLHTPRAVLSPKNDLTNIVGVSKLFATPKVNKSPKNDLTKVSGIKRILKTPKVVSSPKNDLRNIVGIKKLLATPKDPKSPKNDLTNVIGVKKILTTPKKQKSPMNDLTEIRGVKKLMATPKDHKSPKNDLTKIQGVKKLMATPREQKPPTNDLTKIHGVKKLMATPKEQKSPRNDLTNIHGVKKLLATPKEHKSPKNDLTKIHGVKKLMATPRDQKLPKNDLTNVAGVKKLLTTPKEMKQPKNDLSDVGGVRELIKTPKKGSDDILDLMDDETSVFDSLFDETGLRKVIRTYSRSPKKQEVPEIQEHVLEWVEEQSKIKAKTSRLRKKRINDTLEENKDESMSKKPKTVKKTRSKATKKQLNETTDDLDDHSEISNKPASTPLQDENSSMKKTISRKRTTRRKVDEDSNGNTETVEKTITNSNLHEKTESSSVKSTNIRNTRRKKPNEEDKVKEQNAETSQSKNETPNLKRTRRGKEIHEEENSEILQTPEIKTRRTRRKMDEITNDSVNNLPDATKGRSRRNVVENPVESTVEVKSTRNNAKRKRNGSDEENTKKEKVEEAKPKRGRAKKNLEEVEEKSETVRSRRVHQKKSEEIEKSNKKEIEEKDEEIELSSRTKRGRTRGVRNIVDEKTLKVENEPKKTRSRKKIVDISEENEKSMHVKSPAKKVSKKNMKQVSFEIDSKSNTINESTEELSLRRSKRARK